MTNSNSCDLEARSVPLADPRTSFSKIITHREVPGGKEIIFLRTCKSIEKGTLNIVHILSLGHEEAILRS